MDKDMDKNWRLVGVTLGLSIATAIAGGIGVWVLTDYESWDSVKFHSYDVGLFFVVHLRTNGPLTTYKDVTIEHIQVLGMPSMTVNSTKLTISASKGLYQIECESSRDYVMGEDINEFWKDSPCSGRTIFTQYGLQNMTATLKTEPGGWQVVDQSSDDGSVYILPKEIDDNWIFGRMAALGIVIGVAVIGIPSAVKAYCDLLSGR